MRWLVAGMVAVNVGNALTLALDPTWASGWLLLGRERNPSTWLAGAMLASAAGSAWLVGTRHPDRRLWNLVGVLLLGMSLDEVSGFHERLGVGDAGPDLGGRGWVVFGVLAVVAVAVKLVPWALRLEAHLLVCVLAGAAVFVTGSIGLEVVAGAWAGDQGRDVVYWTLETIEENLEMLGVLIVVRGLLGEARRIGATFQIR